MTPVWWDARDGYDCVLAPLIVSHGSERPMDEAALDAVCMGTSHVRARRSQFAHGTITGDRS